MSAPIALRQLRKTFGDHVAVERLDLDIAQGEFLVLLGPSGCGKSTTLNMIAGLEQPTSGQILFGGKDVTDLPPHQRNIAMVFQSALLYPHLTARQNIEASLRHSGLDAAAREKRIAEAVAMLDIGDLLGKRPAQMSGGQRQRVATAKAIVREPAAFLLDEPLSALDAALRQSLRADLVNLQKRLGSTTIFVTHDQVEAMTMGDRIAVMRDGRLEQIGSPGEVYGSPATLFVAGFVGSPPMNLLPGTIEGGRFRCGDLALPMAGAAGPAVLGIRPQHLEVREAGGPGTLPVSVFALEHLGRESVLILEGPGRDKLRALVPPEFDARVGQSLHVTADPARCHLFDPSSGKRR
ncbi:MAG: ABC transporter ATP-binding protein [Geminicoccaceae bacterium]